MGGKWATGYSDTGGKSSDGCGGYGIRGEYGACGGGGHGNYNRGRISIITYYYLFNYLS